MYITYYPNGNPGEVLPIALGGTGARTVEGAAKSLKLVTRAEANQPFKAVLLNELGQLDPQLIPPGIEGVYVPSVYGPSTVQGGTTVTFEITNYSREIVYSLSAIGGTASRSIEVISFTALNNVTEGQLVVNGTSYAFVIVPTP